MNTVLLSNAVSPLWELAFLKEPLTSGHSFWVSTHLIGGWCQWKCVASLPNFSLCPHRKQKTIWEHPSVKSQYANASREANTQAVVLILKCKRQKAQPALKANLKCSHQGILSLARKWFFFPFKQSRCKAVWQHSHLLGNKGPRWLLSHSWPLSNLYHLA